MFGRAIVSGLTCFALLLGGSLANAGRFIEIKNVDSSTGRLSDLIVYGAGGESNVIFKPGDPLDDVELRGGQSIVRDAGFEIASYSISESSFTDPTKERESTLIRVKPLQERKVGYLETPGGNTLFLSRDDQVAALALPATGALLSFTNGLNTTDSLLLGWFVGQSINFSTGVVSNPYTGQATFVGSPFQVTLSPVPEPSTLLLLATGGSALWLHRRRGRGRAGATPPPTA